MRANYMKHSEPLHVALIGGSGFIGTRLCKRLLTDDLRIHIIDKRKSVSFPEICSVADVSNRASLSKHLRECNVIYNLAAEHRDDVTPRSLYWDVNVKGAENVCSAAEELGINKIVFTSTVAVYGFTDSETDELGELAPFNDYGKTKLEAEEVYRAWQERSHERSLTIVRPTVVFGEANRGNVYNLLDQIAKGKFIMVGKGKNHKSMAYVENVASFLEFALGFGPGYHLFNYVDKPDFDMNSLVRTVKKELSDRTGIGLRIPYVAGYLGGVFFDFLSKMTGKKFPISSVRIKKFCSNTQFMSTKIVETGFVEPFSLEDGLRKTIHHEFLEALNDEEVFYTE